MRAFLKLLIYYQDLGLIYKKITLKKVLFIIK